MQANDLIFIAEAHTGLKTQLVNASLVAAAEYRLDAPSFLARQNVAGRLQFFGEGQTVSDLADVFTVYIQSPELAYVQPFANSRPYMTTSELAEYENGRATHVSLTADPRLIGWEIKEGNIVVSRSGRVGEAYWVDKRLDGVLVGDSFRVVPKKADDRFFLYALLSSSMARNFLSGSAYGSVVDHASLDQLRRFPIPPVSTAVRKQVSEKVRRALQSRDDAYDLLDEAQSILLISNALSPLSTSKHSELGDFASAHSFVSSNDLLDCENNRTEFRLDAHFYNPMARVAIGKIQKCPSLKRTIGDVTEDIRMSPLFVRKYVTKEHGVPYIAGKQISQVKPEFKYISRTETQDLETHILHAGWTLMTCAGTVGKVGYVSSLLDGAAAQDVMRIIPNDTEIDGGYLNAWLSSDYGRVLIERCRYGSVVDRVSPNQTAGILIPIPPTRTQQREIGDKVRLAYEKRADALCLEAEAQEILMREIEGHKPQGS